LAGARDAGALAVTIATSEPQRAIEIIAREPGVTAVTIAERLNGTTRLLVHAAQSRPSASELASVLGRAEIAADEIYLERPTLDDVFRQITNGTEP
jgi:hypothetical protein